MPAKKRQGVNIVKIPLPRKHAFNERAFPPLPVLYLELIENKDKIKQDLINKEFVPKGYTKEQIENLAQSKVEEDNRPEEPEPQLCDTERVERDEDEKKSHKRENGHHSRDRESKDKESRDRSSKDDRESRKENGYHHSRDRESRDSHKHRKPVLSDSDSEDDDHSHQSPKSPVDEMEARLVELLRDDNVGKHSKRSNASSSSEGYRPPPSTSTHANETRNDSRDNDSRSVRSTHGTYVHEISDNPPTLADLEKQGVYTKSYRNIDPTSIDDEDEKRELLYKFEVLKKKYKECTIPEFTMHSDYSTMMKSYQSTLRRVDLDKNVDSYKRYLFSGFMLIEYTLGKMAKFDMNGYTQHQMANIDAYETLLIELGEKSYVPEGSRWPVEIRLVALVLMNTASFIFMNMVMKSVNTRYGGGFSNGGGGVSGGFASGGTFTSGGRTGTFASGGGFTSQPTTQKRKMRGPDLEDLPEVV